MDKVKTHDYLNYLVNIVLPRWKEMSAEVKARYKVCKEEYERGYLPTLFNWKFENSRLGDTSFMGLWDFYERHIVEIEQEIQRVTYHRKIEQQCIEIGSGFCQDGFYKWCSENNIPY